MSDSDFDVEHGAHINHIRRRVQIHDSGDESSSSSSLTNDDFHYGTSLLADSGNSALDATNRFNNNASMVFDRDAVRIRTPEEPFHLIPV